MNTNKLADVVEDLLKKEPILQRKPDEISGLNIEAKIKIFDPETNEIFLEGRG